MALIDIWEKSAEDREDENLQRKKRNIEGQQQRQADNEKRRKLVQVIHNEALEDKKQRLDVIVEMQNKNKADHEKAVADKSQRQDVIVETKKKNKAAHEKALADKKQRQDEKDERRSYVWGYKAGIETKQTSSNDSYQQIG